MSIALNPASNLDKLLYNRRETFSCIATFIGFIAIVFFGEKLTKIDIFGMILVIIGIIILGQKRSSVHY